MMKVTNTKITDTNFAQDSDAFKIILMNQILDHFLPLFQEEIKEKKGILESHVSDFNKLKQEVSKTREKLVKLQNGLRREKVVQEILEETAILYTHDILYGGNKKTVLDILDSVNLVGYPELILQLKTLRTLAHKNIQKVQINT